MKCKECSSEESELCNWFVTNEGNFCSEKCMFDWRFKVFELNCDRCGSASERLYEIHDRNEDDELITKKVCWDCDHDIMNGGDFYADAGVVLMDRAENNYAFDPINTEKPSWMP